MPVSEGSESQSSCLICVCKAVYLFMYVCLNCCLYFCLYSVWPSFCNNCMTVCLYVLVCPSVYMSSSMSSCNLFDCMSVCLYVYLSTKLFLNTHLALRVWRMVITMKGISVKRKKMITMMSMIVVFFASRNFRFSRKCRRLNKKNKVRLNLKIKFNNNLTCREW